ncbi:MAG TPA: hypothetical protein VFD82_20605 [Planctomycetota bacterium]|nr:hypothetical protein [Planctomycetota bacterium]
MNLALAWCGKEWRAQRGFLLGYAALMFATVAAVLTIAHWRNVFLQDQSRLAAAVLVFGVTGAIGCVFAAAHAVRGESVGRDDQLWRRLPGALLPAFAGKLLFVALLLPGLVLAGFAVGQLYVAAMGFDFASALAIADLVAVYPDAFFTGCSLLPWVFAVACWMPGARLAIGATALLVAGLATAVSGVLAPARGLADTLAGTMLWSWTLGLGLAVAGVSCVIGRRGGSHARSAKLGAATAFVGLVPCAAWLGSWLLAYWWPDAQRLLYFNGVGVTADGRYAVIQGPARYRWPDFAVRIDLKTGEATQLSAPGEQTTTTCDLPAEAAIRAGFAVIWDVATGVVRVVELATLTSSATTMDERHMPVDLPAALAATRRSMSPLRQPGNLPAWFEGGELCLQMADGTVAREPLVPRHGFCRPAGHGFVHMNADRQPGAAWHGYDLATRRRFALPADVSSRCIAVAGTWLLWPQGRDRPWQRFDPSTGQATPIPALPYHSDCLGLLDDATAVFCNPRANQTPVIGLYRPQSDEFVELQLPSHRFVQEERWNASRGQGDAVYGQRDPRGRMLLYLSRQKPGNLIIAVDPATHACEVLLKTELLAQILAFPSDTEAVCCEDYRFFVRYDLRSGARTVIYPREAQ